MWGISSPSSNPFSKYSPISWAIIPERERFLYVQRGADYLECSRESGVQCPQNMCFCFTHLDCWINTREPFWFMWLNWNGFVQCVHMEHLEFLAQLLQTGGRGGDSRWSVVLARLGGRDWGAYMRRFYYSMPWVHTFEPQIFLGISCRGSVGPYTSASHMPWTLQWLTPLFGLMVQNAKICQLFNYPERNAWLFINSRANILKTF